MKRPATKIVAAAFAAGAALIGVSAVRVATRERAAGIAASDETCGAGFFRAGTRCCPTKEAPPGPGLCAVGPPSSAGCPSPLVATPRGCDAPGAEGSVAGAAASTASTVLVPKTRATIGPSDWEAEGRVAPRVVVAGPFRIDRLEVTVGGLRCATCPVEVAARFETGIDPGRAASSVTLHEARAVCKARGGRLPTEDEWIVAAAGDKPRRYPWGDTGAVCRRAAWGLVRGPCATGAAGPDTVGAHHDGATPLGVEDLAGNVAEWVETGKCPDGGPPPRPAADGGGPRGECLGAVRGGSYETDLATELRTWVRRDVSSETRDPTIGFRCAYDAVPSGTPP